MKNTRVIMNVIIATLMGIALCLLVKALGAHRDLQSNAVYIAEMSAEILPGQLITAESILSGMEEVQTSSVQLVRSDEALQTMKKDMPELSYLAENPFRDIITFQTNGIPIREFAALKEKLLDIEGVNDVYHDQSLTQMIESKLNRPRIGMILVSIIIALGTFMALCLRVKRDLREYEEEMKILSLSGADNETILKTRLNWSVKWGGISALLAGVVTLINIFFINKTLLQGMEISFLQGVMAIIGMISLVVMAHALITYQTIQTYLAKLNPSIRS